MVYNYVWGERGSKGGDVTPQGDDLKPTQKNIVYS